MKFLTSITILGHFISFVCHGAIGLANNDKSSANINQAILVSHGVLSELTLQKLKSALPVHRISVQDPYEKDLIELEGFAFLAVLDLSFGTQWREWNHLQINCLDGYEVLIPVKNVIQNHPWLAFRRVDSQKFKLIRRDLLPSREIDLSPFYLVWNSSSEPQMKDTSVFPWPFQISQMGPMKASKTAAQPVIRYGASKNVIQGFSLFQSHCMNCHSINGKGGKVGPELAHPRSPTEYWNRKFLKMWVLQPTSIRSDAKMPAFDENIPEREKKVDQILDYLSDLASHR